jgi:hypothetical protein
MQAVRGESVLQFSYFLNTIILLDLMILVDQNLRIVNKTVNEMLKSQLYKTKAI